MIKKIKQKNKLQMSFYISNILTMFTFQQHDNHLYPITFILSNYYQCLHVNTSILCIFSCEVLYLCLCWYI